MFSPFFFRLLDNKLLVNYKKKKKNKMLFNFLFELFNTFWFDFLKLPSKCQILQLVYFCSYSACMNEYECVTKTVITANPLSIYAPFVSPSSFLFLPFFIILLSFTAVITLPVRFFPTATL